MFFVYFIFITLVFFPLNLWLTQENLVIHLFLERKEKNTLSNPTQKNGFTWECFAKKILKNVSFISIDKLLKIIVVLKFTLKTVLFR